MIGQVGVSPARTGSNGDLELPFAANEPQPRLDRWNSRGGVDERPRKHGDEALAGAPDRRWNGARRQQAGHRRQQQDHQDDRTDRRAEEDAGQRSICAARDPTALRRSPAELSRSRLAGTIADAASSTTGAYADGVLVTRPRRDARLPVRLETPILRLRHEHPPRRIPDLKGVGCTPLRRCPSAGAPGSTRCHRARSASRRTAERPTREGRAQTSRSTTAGSRRERSVRSMTQHTSADDTICGPTPPTQGGTGCQTVGVILTARSTPSTLDWRRRRPSGRRQSSNPRPTSRQTTSFAGCAEASS